MEDRHWSRENMRKAKDLKRKFGMFSVSLIKYRQNNAELKITTGNTFISYNLSNLFSKASHCFFLPFWLNFRIVNRWFIYLPKMIFSSSPFYLFFSIGPFALLRTSPSKNSILLFHLWRGTTRHFYAVYSGNRKARDTTFQHLPNFATRANGPKSGPFTHPAPSSYTLTQYTRTLLLL